MASLKRRKGKVVDHLIYEMKKRPNDFKVIERIPFTLETMAYPYELDCAAGDEVPILLLDVETTGFDATKCGVTELGLTRIAYSPSLGRITRIENSASFFNDPGHPIPAEITALTGISDNDVRGKAVTRDDIAHFFSGDVICVAHNAAFDRQFAERHLPIPKNLRWACSINDIDWAGFESKKLSWICYQLGGFFDAHRAEVDTQALSWVFYKRPDLLQQLMQAVGKRTAVIRAFGSPYEAKDALKAKGFRWNDGDAGTQKHWSYSCSEDELEATMDFLEGFYPARKLAKVELLDARSRFL